MDKNECSDEKVSARTVGVFILLATVLIAFVGLLIVPMLGIFFAVPFLILGFAFVFAPESSICRKLMPKND